MSFIPTTFSAILAGLIVLATWQGVPALWRYFRLARKADATGKIIIVEGVQKKKSVVYTRAQLWELTKNDLKLLVRRICALLAVSFIIPTQFINTLLMSDSVLQHLLAWTVVLTTLLVTYWGYTSEPEIKGDPRIKGRHRDMTEWYNRHVMKFIWVMMFTFLVVYFYMLPDTWTRRQEIARLRQEIARIEAERAQATYEYEQLLAGHPVPNSMYDKWKASTQPASQPATAP